MEDLKTMKHGNICWFNQLVPPGLMPEINIFYFNLKYLLIQGEKVISDEEYRSNAQNCKLLKNK